MGMVVPYEGENLNGLRARLPKLGAVGVAGGGG